MDVPQSTTELLRLKRLERQACIRMAKMNGRSSSSWKTAHRIPWKGTLQFRDVTVDQTTGSVILRVVVPNPEGGPPAGHVRPRRGGGGYPEQAILVPQQGVSRIQREIPSPSSWMRTERSQQRMITLDRAIGDNWLVSSGLSAGDRVIVEGMQKVRPGTTVKAPPGRSPRPA